MTNETLEFSTHDVTINADGRVIINNPAFAKALINTLGKLDPNIASGILDNCPVNGKCGGIEGPLDKVDLRDAMEDIKLTLGANGPVNIFNKRAPVSK